ncbi:MAG: AbrB/MazE/SpoVT family DNA-binding domain-containing protein, partial [Bacteroidetes bacterium]|nr:AbrB/MazE/SpoVT family DNA-binding domain-containing protein [Bacteroidota bacterium]
MTTATISSKGQLALPKEIRVTLGLRFGFRANFVRMEDDNYAMLPATYSVKTLKVSIRKTHILGHGKLESFLRMLHLV